LESSGGAAVLGGADKRRQSLAAEHKRGLPSLVQLRAEVARLVVLAGAPKP